jgi:hypothetical protein
MSYGPETKLNLFILTGQADEDQLLKAGEEHDHSKVLGTRA